MPRVNKTPLTHKKTRNLRDFSKALNSRDYKAAAKAARKAGMRKTASGIRTGNINKIYAEKGLLLREANRNRIAEVAKKGNNIIIANRELRSIDPTKFSDEGVKKLAKRMTFRSDGLRRFRYYGYGLAAGAGTGYYVASDRMVNTPSIQNPTPLLGAAVGSIVGGVTGIGMARNIEKSNQNKFYKFAASPTKNGLTPKKKYIDDFGNVRKVKKRAKK